MTWMRVGEIEITEDERMLRWHNRTDHLPADLITV